MDLDCHGNDGRQYPRAVPLDPVTLANAQQRNSVRPHRAPGAGRGAPRLQCLTGRLRRIACAAVANAQLLSTHSQQVLKARMPFWTRFLGLVRTSTGPANK